MDLFTLSDSSFDVVLEDATDKSLKGATKVTWVERYNLPGEFEIIGEPRDLLKSFPLGMVGSLVSHSKSSEIMIVEEQLIDESEGSDPQMVLRGRTVSTHLMENRVVIAKESGVQGGIWNLNGFENLTDYPPRYDISTVASWQAAFDLLYDYIQGGADPDLAIPNMFVMTDGFMNYEDIQATRFTKRLSYLSEVIYELAKATDFGIKIVRPGAEATYYTDLYTAQGNSFGTSDPLKSAMFVVYRGVDRTKADEPVLFDFNNGDLAKVRYLWTNRKQKTGYYATDEVRTVKDFYNKTAWDLKLARVDATDYVSNLAENDPNFDDDNRTVLMSRGKDYLNVANSESIIIDAVGSKKAGPVYGIDYKLGDIVKVFGNYGVSQNMRVTEVAFIQDGKNEAMYPTFIPPYNIHEIQGG